MRKMKDSGVEWIGLIPKDWMFARIGSLYGLRVEKVSDRDYQPLSVTKLGILPQLETVAKTDAHDARKLVKKGDFAINSRSDRRGSCGISEYDGSVSLINTVLYPITEMSPQYYNWFFHTTEFADEFYRWGHGIVDDLWTTGWQEMKNIVIVQPPLSEQCRIAAYLDHKCSEIDALAADIKKQIETLEEYKRSVITEAVTKGLDPDVKMKNSGVEWFGAIPQKWELIKSRYVIETIGDVDHYMPKSEDAGYPYVMIGDLSNKASNISFDICKQISASDYKMLSRKIKPIKDNVILARYATIGTVCYVDVDCDFIVSYACVTIRTVKKMLSGLFLFYYLKSSAFFEEVRQYINSNTQGNVGIESLYKVKIPIPPLKEQQQIAAYLDHKCSEIDSVIKDKNKQLETLAEYKKSLIYEYVTGKKEV